LLIWGLVFTGNDKKTIQSPQVWTVDTLPKLTPLHK